MSASCAAPHEAHVACLLHGITTKLLLLCVADPGSAGPALKATAKPSAVKPKAPKTAKTATPWFLRNSKGADPDASSEGAAGRKLPHAQNAYFFYMADKRAGLNGKGTACGSRAFILARLAYGLLSCFETIFVLNQPVHTSRVVPNIACCRTELHPGLDAVKASKKLGEMWRELSEANKQPYNVSSYAILPHASQVPKLVHP